MSGERIVEWLFIPWETFMSSSYFGLASHKRKRKHVSPPCLRREGRQSTGARSAAHTSRHVGRWVL